MDPTTIAVIAILAAAGSEIITLLPMRENSWIQLLIKVLNAIAQKK
jgi:hypothetical protein